MLISVFVEELWCLHQTMPVSSLNMDPQVVLFNIHHEDLKLSFFLGERLEIYV